MSAPSHPSRTPQGAARLALATSSVAPVAYGYERWASRSGGGGATASAFRPAPSSLRRQRPSDGSLSRLARTIQAGGDR